MEEDRFDAVCKTVAELLAESYPYDLHARAAVAGVVQVAMLHAITRTDDRVDEEKLMLDAHEYLDSLFRIMKIVPNAVKVTVTGAH